MATVFKRKGNRRWSVSWFDAETEKWRERTGYTDKALSLKEGERLENEAGKRKTGMTNPIDAQKNRPIREHLDEFINGKIAGGRTAKQIMEVRNKITRIIEGTGANFIHQLDSVRVNAFLADLRIKGQQLGGVTRNKYAMTIQAFTKWAVVNRRIEADPLAGLQRIESRSIAARHPRRALSVDEIARLLDATERRPLMEFQMIRRGKNKGKLMANIRSEILAKAKRVGANRRLAYLLAVWTGLRRGELKLLRWSDIDFGTIPVRIRLRAETTKSKRADTLALHPQIERELRAIRPATECEDAPILSAVPGMMALRADLKLAGVDAGTRLTGFVDFHCLRKTLSTMMAAAGMSQRARQAHMRHTDPRLTEGAYMDERLLPIAAELSKLPDIPDANSEPPQALPIPLTGTDAAHH